MPCQLTIKSLDGNPELKQLRHFDDCPITIGNRQSSLCLDGLKSVYATISQKEDGSYLLNSADETLRHNGKALELNASVPLHSGDTLELSTWRLQFYVCHPRVRQSWKSSLLARFSQGAIIVIVLTILASILWLPNYFQSTTSFGTAAALEQLALQLDQTRAKISKTKLAEHSSTLEQLLLEQLQADLNARIRYVRKYDRRLSREQLEQQAQQLDAIEDLLDRVVAGNIFAPLPAPAIDKATRNILKNSALPR